MARPLSILDLPVKIQERICKYAELTGFTHDLNFSYLDLYPLHEYPKSDWVKYSFCFHDAGEIIRREDYHTLEEYWEVPHDAWSVFPDPYVLCKNPTCDSMATESCSSFFYAKCTVPELFRIMIQGNHLRICQGSPGGFKPFFDLPKEVLTELRTLTVRLDGEPPEAIKCGDDWMRREDLIPFNICSRYGKSAIKAWEKLVGRLAACILPSCLTLYIVAKAPDVQTAQAILNPLEQLPALRGCGVYLNSKPMPEVIALAKATVERLSTPVNCARSIPFRYLDLPQELRNRILEFSDLVSDVDLEWKPSLTRITPFLSGRCSCFDILGERLYSIGHLDDCSLEEINGMNVQRYIFDWGGSSGQTEVFSPGHCCRSEDKIFHPKLCRKDSGGFCACLFQCQHSVYTNTVIPRSRVGPHPLFLVSRQVRQDAIPIFFLRNKFVITPPGVIPTRYASVNPGRLHLYDQNIPMRRTELSLFLSMIPPNAFQYIRYLEWVPPQFENYTSAPKSAFLDYIDTVEMMVHAMHLPKLTLVLNLRVMDKDYDGDDILKWPRRSRRDGAMYDALLKPLCRLKGLKDCFIYLRRIEYGYYYSEHDGCVFDNDEMRYEKAIMGPDYDSWKRGKPMTERFERMIYTKPCNGRYADFVDA